MRWLLALLMVSSPIWSNAGELDNEKQVVNQIESAKNLPRTVVVRVNKNTNEVQVMHSGQALAPAAATVKSFNGQNFTPVLPNQKVRNELDRDSSSSSWFFNLSLTPLFNVGFGSSSGAFYNPYYYGGAYYGGYGYYNQYYTPYYPTYYYNNYSYSYYPYYSYGYGPYQYYMYRWWY